MTEPAAGSRFEDFYATEFAATTRLAHLLTGRDDVAEDLAQDAMARIHRHFDGLDNPAASADGQDWVLSDSALSGPRTGLVATSLGWVGIGSERDVDYSALGPGSQGPLPMPENTTVWLARA